MIRRLYTYISPDTDPYRNLALEAYLTDVADSGCCILYLWQNENTVVIGRNQNAWKECRTGLLESEGGKLARRLSGGGAVYHDRGNLNFTFCVAEENYDLRRQQQVLLRACQLLGIEAELSGRNDLTAGGRKFSGNSFYHHEGKAFHNGTLLIDADMERLGRYLTPSPAKIASKSVDSVSARVVNLKTLCPSLTVKRIETAMIQAFGQVYGLTPVELYRADFDRQVLEDGCRRFSSREWIYGTTPPFDISFGARFPWGEISLQWQVEKGLCRKAAVYTDAMDAELPRRLETALEGCTFTTEALCAAVTDAALAEDAAHDLRDLIRAQDI